MPHSSLAARAFFGTVKGLCQLCLAMLLMLPGLAQAAFTITRTSAPLMYIDTGDNLVATYVSYQVTSSANESDVWVGIGSFTGAVVDLAASASSVVHFGPMSAGQTRTAFFYLRATGTTAAAQGHTISIYGAKPPAAALASSTFSLSAVESTIAANANKVNSTVTGPDPAGLGGTVTMTVQGGTGTLGAAGILSFTPASYPGWRADAYELFETTITLPSGAVLSNRLYTSGQTVGGVYSAVYKFRAVGTTSTPTTVSPVGYISSGTQVKHTSVADLATLAPISPTVNTLTLAKSLAPTTPSGGSTVSFTLRVSNGSGYPAMLDRIIDSMPTLPATLSYVTGSATWGGGALPDPVISGQTLTWSGDLTVPANGSRDLVFQAVVPSTPGTYTNTAIAQVGNEQIDTTVNTTDNSPASAGFSIGPDLRITKSHVGNFTQAASGSYTIGVDNIGNASSAGQVTVSDVLPTGLTPSTANGSGWTCGIVVQTVTCTRADALAAAASYPAITLGVNVAANASSALVNTATLSGGGDVNSSNNSSSDNTVVNPAPADMAVAITGLAAFSGPGGTLTGNLVCTNSGPGTALSATCSATVDGGSVVVGACVASSGTAASLPSGATLTCPVTLTAPGTAGTTDTTAIRVTLTATTSASNDSSNGNNSIGASADLVDAVGSSASLPSGGGTLSLLGNDTLGSASASVSTVSVSITANGGLAGLTLDITGALVVPPGAAAGTYAVGYQICALATPGACDSAQATVTVASPADMTLAISGLAAAAAPGDTVSATLTCINSGGSPASQASCDLSGLPSGASVTCTPASPQTSLAAGASLVCSFSFTAPSTGSVLVGASTGSTGDANSGNNNASATLVVVDAVPDSTTLSAAGGLVSLLGNDSLGATAATLLNANVSIIAAGGLSGASIDGSGRLVVPSGTAAGTYAVSYRICALSTPTACDTAVASITVQAPGDMAVSFTGLPTLAAPGSTVSGSISCTNVGASPAIDASCSVSGLPAGGNLSCSPLAPQSSLAVGGIITCGISYVAPASGTVTLTASTSSTGDGNATDNSASGSTSIVDAAADMASLAAGGGTVAVLGNDSLGGSAASVANVTVSLTADGGLTGASVDGSGRIVVPAGASAGTYALSYRICTVASPLVCDTAEVTITIGTPADMGVSLAGFATQAGPGDPVTGTLTCTNLGGSAASNASCGTSGLPVGASTNCLPTSPQLSLAPGASMVCSVSYLAPASGSFSWAATTSATGDSQPGNNSSTATLSVVDAVADSASLPAGGGTLSLRANDLLGSAPAGSADTTFSLLGNGGLSGASLDASGQLLVPAGLPAGSYALSYRLCAATTPTACDSAIASITIAAPEDMAVVIHGLASSAAPGSTVNGSFSCTNIGSSPAGNAGCSLSGMPAGAVLSCSPASPQGSLAIGASINCSFSFTAPSSGLLTLQASTSSAADALTANNSSSATLGIVDAVADSATLPAHGGVVVLLVNDTLGGLAASTANSTLSIVSAGGLVGATLDASGHLLVPPGTPAGSHLLSYRLCDASAPAVCDTASITLTISSPADMAVSLAGLPVFAAPGTAQTVTATCSNGGASAAQNASCGISGLPAGASLSCAPASPLASLAVGGVIVCTATFSTPASGMVTLSAVTDSTGDASLANHLAAASLAVIDAAADVSGTTSLGGSVDLLANDRLGGSPVSTAVVIVSLVNAGGMSGASIDGSGRLVVPAGTATGSYVLSYRICASAAPTVCDTALATLSVSTPPDMSVSIVPAITQAAPGAMVTATITCVNGGGADAAQARCGVTSLPPGGSISCTPPSPTATLAPGSSITCLVSYPAPGSGNITWTAITGATIDVGSGNDSATGTLTVVDATADSATLPASGGTVALLANDTLGSGVPTTPAQVSLTLQSNGGLATVSIDSAGNLIVPAGSPPGNYSLVYRICSAATPTACDTAALALTVLTPADMAVSISGWPAHTTPGAVLTASLTCTNSGGSPASAASCASSSLPSGATLSCSPGPAVTTLAAGASIVCSVVATAPASGTLTLQASTQASNDAQTANNSASATLLVVDAVADVAGVTASGGTVDLLANDRIGSTPASPANVSFSLTSLGGLAGASIDPSGRLVVPAGVPAGSYLLGYRACAVATPTACDTTTATVNVGTPADMLATLAALPVAVRPGAALTLTASCTNVGGSPASQAACALGGLPPGTPSSCTPAVAQASLAVGGSISCSASFLAPASGSLALSATASAAADSQPSNNGAGASVAIVRAAADSASLPASGGSVALLANDTLGSAAATPSTTSATLLSTGGLPGLSIDAGGQLVVPAGTPAGSYALAYQLCALSAPGACDTGTVSLTVLGAADLVASFAGLPTHAAPLSTISGSATCNNSGHSASSNASCTVSGLPAGASLSCLPASPQASLAAGSGIVCSFSFVVPATGLVTLQVTAASALDGNPANNSAQASVAVVDAVADAISLSVGGGSMALLGNDSVGGSAASTALASASVLDAAGIAGLAIDASGRLVVPAGLAAGSYSPSYRLCALAAPAACDSATVTLTIGSGAALIVDVAGFPAVSSPGAGVGGTVTCTNNGGTPALAASCSISGQPAGASLSCTPGNPVASLAPGSSIVCSVSYVAPASGTVQILATASASNVPGGSQATTTLASSVIDAQDDAATLPGSGGRASLLANDRLGTTAATAVDSAASAVGSWPAGITLDSSSGEVIVAPGTADGRHVLSYRICARSQLTSCDGAVLALDIVSANMQASFSGLPETVAPGARVTLTLSCRNLGPAIALDARCMPMGVPAGATVSCSPPSPQPTLAAGSAIVCSVSFDAPGTPTRLALSATASASNDNTPANDRSDVTLVVADHRLDVVKSPASPAFVQSGATAFDLNYLIVLKAQGADAVPNVQVSDSLSRSLGAGNPVIRVLQLTVTDGPCTADPAFDGLAHTSLLTGRDTLPAGATCSLALRVRLSWSRAADVPRGDLGNLAYASGLPGTGVNPGHHFPMGGPPVAPAGAVAQDISTDAAAPPATPQGDAPQGSAATIRLPLLTTVAGGVFIDGNGNGRVDAGEQPQGRYLVQVLVPDDPTQPTAGGRLLTYLQAVTAADGSYTLPGVPAGQALAVRFLPLAEGSGLTPETAVPAVPATQAGSPVLGGTPVNGAPTLNTSPTPPTRAYLPLFIDPALVAPGATVPGQSLPIDPSGVVYDSVTRRPIAGATVQLQSANGSPVPAGTLIPGTSHTVVTNADGLYAFLLEARAIPGTYRLAVVPPSSHVASASLKPDPALNVPSGSGPYLVQAQSVAPTGAQPTTHHLEFRFALARDVVHNHIPLDPRDGQALFVDKQADRREALVGDSVGYRVRVRNPNGFAIAGVQLQDRLPLGFQLVPGSMRLTTGTQTTALADPPGAPGPHLQLALGAVPARSELLLTYRLRVGIGAERGDGANRARASAAGGMLASATAVATVSVRGGVFGREACVIGKVYADCNDNRRQDDGEPGVPDVRLVLEDGTTLTTDVNGQYSLCGLRSVTHVLRLDEQTLPVGALLGLTGSRNAGRAHSLFVDLQAGELHRADFRLVGCPAPLTHDISQRRARPAAAASTQGSRP